VEVASRKRAIRRLTVPDVPCIAKFSRRVGAKVGYRTDGLGGATFNRPFGLFSKFYGSVREDDG
jgi:hypothetical protein